MANKYQKFGLRADKNLTDLENKQVALTNMLEGLKVDDDGFIPSDLLAISGLRNTEVTVDDLKQVGTDGNLLTYSPVDQPGVTLPVRPLVRIVDRIENYKVITGTPPFINGGDGPNAWFIPSTYTRPLSQLSKTTTGDVGSLILNKTGQDAIGPVEFWDNGVFRFGIKVNDEFDDTYGLVQWEGWTSISRFTIQSTGYYLIEYDPIGAGYETVKSLYNKQRTLAYTSATDDGSTTVVTLAQGEVVFANVGDFVTVNSVDHLVSKVDNETGVITFDSSFGITTTGGNITLNFKPSDEPVQSGEIMLRETYTGDMFKIRITVWWLDDGTGDRLPTKNFAFYDTDSERYPFSYFYKSYTRGLEPAEGTYQYFAKYKASPLAQSSTAAIESSETIAIQYRPPVNASDKVIKTSVTCEYKGLGKLTAVTGNFSGCEVGDWLVFQASTTWVAYQITQKESDSTVWVHYSNPENALSLAMDDLVTLHVVDHIGLIGIYEGVSASGLSASFSAVNGGPATSEVRADYLVAGIDFSTVSNNTKFKRITAVSGNSLTASAIHGESETFGTAADDFVMLVYASKGLEDLSSVVQCAGVFGKEAKGTSSGTSLQVSDTIGIVASPSGANPKTYVQYLTGSSAPNRIDLGIYVTAINGNTLTLSGNITGTIAEGATIVFIPNTAYTGSNKEYCVLPLNTAPPFAGTDSGLATTTAYPNIQFEGLKFTNVALKSVTSAESSTTTYSQYIDIANGSDNYKLLIV